MPCPGCTRSRWNDQCERGPSAARWSHANPARPPPPRVPPPPPPGPRVPRGGRGPPHLSLHRSRVAPEASAIATVPNQSKGVTMHVEEGPRQGFGLTRIVRACADHPGRTIGVWLAVIVAIVAASQMFGGKLVNSSSIPGSDSQHAVDLLKARFPERAGDSARVVFAADKVLTNADGRKAVAAAS